jgi:hypothetical protein
MKPNQGNRIMKFFTKIIDNVNHQAEQAIKAYKAHEGKKSTKLDKVQ